MYKSTEKKSKNVQCKKGQNTNLSDGSNRRHRGPNTNKGVKGD